MPDIPLRRDRFVEPFKRFVLENAMPLVAFAAAVISTFYVPVDLGYLSYFDSRTLITLFCVLAVVQALSHEQVFSALARALAMHFKTIRSIIAVIVFITFAGSMLITNDMALITFLPLSFFVLSAARREDRLAFVFVLQSIAANLGGMLTPFGNPQNLYLYSRYSIPTGDFLQIMAFPFGISLILIALCCLFVKNEPLLLIDEKPALDRRRVLFFLALFAVVLLGVLRVIPPLITLLAVVVTLALFDREALREVDSGLLLTFVFFFIFAGNLARIEAVQEFFKWAFGLGTHGVLLTSALASQVISNVPSAILLSAFTGDYAQLLVGVNIGGVGTVVASLASLIALREYQHRTPGKTRRFIKVFSVLNLGFLAILLVCCCLFM